MYVLLLALDDISSLGPDEKLAAGEPFLVTLVLLLLLLLFAFKMLVLLVKIELVDDEFVNLFDEFIFIDNLGSI